jgi:hypothetical protein
VPVTKEFYSYRMEKMIKNLDPRDILDLNQYPIINSIYSEKLNGFFLF